METISVLIPTYNREKYIKECINSILNQTFKNLNIIIYDDGSNDNTVSIIKGINDDRIKLIRGSKNMGPSEARNILLEECNTFIACWQDSDDLSNINRIKNQYDTLKENPNSIISCNHKFFSKSSTVNIYEDPSSTGRGSSFGASMFEVDKSIKFNRERIVGGEDTRWLREHSEKGKKIITLKQCLYYIRNHPERISTLKKHLRKALIEKNPPRDISYEDMLKLIKNNAS